MSDKKFTGTEVFEMTWAVTQAIADSIPARIGSASLPAAVFADAVRMLLEDGSSPIGLRVEARPNGAGVNFLHFTSVKLSR
jgi:hypothetical protein